ncbi:hypothetical protein HRbin36_01790 [bacterium HR36]|nr:hypothetical protein HRbin36_01790 [bacterium HR36]
MDKWQVRPATVADLETVVEFNLALAWESEGKKLDSSQLRAGVAAVLNDPARGRYFLAQQGQVVAGQVMITREWSDWRNGWFWWLQSVYVRPEYRRQGVLRALVVFLEEQAQQQGDVIGLRLYVDKSNHLGRTAYHALGLRDTAYTVMEKYPWASAKR